MKKSALFLIPTTLLIAQVALAAPEGAPSVAAVEIKDQTKEGQLARVNARAIEVQATIEKVDVTKRMITLKGPEGKSITFKVSPEVKRLAEMKAGDKITAKYYEALAFEVRKPTAAELANPTMTVADAEKNSKMLPPGAEAAMVSRTIVTIKAIDLKQEMVTIEFPGGETLAVKAQVPENLTRVKVGDTVAVTYAEGMAIELTPQG